MATKSTSPSLSEFCTEPAVPGDKMEGLSLLTDLYQLTMAQGYWKSGRANTQAVFHVFYRTQPFNGGYSICSGLEPALQWLHALRFTKSDVDYLATLKGNDGKALFDPAFLDYLVSMGPLSLDIDAVPEGTVVFPFEPLVRVKGPILQAQLVETALLCMINFGTLVATKAARICASCQGEPVLEFGFRRAQGLDGALTASRAAFIGGCAATSNVLAGKRYGIPVAGTHAHSWVQSFPSQQEAFDHWAETAPNNCVLLVDTYDTLTGVRDAIKTAKKLVERGYKFAGIRLDSGDLAWLSIEARKLLDAAGFPEAKIFASNDLDEHLVTTLKHQGAAINMWGIGTKLVTCYDQPALGGVYKLAATMEEGETTWKPCIKLSENAIKVSNPGVLNTRRWIVDGEFAGDVIWDECSKPEKAWRAVDPGDATRTKDMPEPNGKNIIAEDMLVPIFRKGELVYRPPPLAEVRARTLKQLEMLSASNKRLINPHSYVVGLEDSLFKHKTELIVAERENVRKLRAAAEASEKK